MSVFERTLLVYILVGLTFICTSSDPTTYNLKDAADKLNDGIENLKNLYPPYAKTEETSSFERELYKRNQDEYRYDFIIIGAGAAGATLARRLAEIPQWKILLVEAGEEEDDITRIPSLFPNLLPTKYNWGYHTIPQKNCCLASKGRKCLYQMGKSLGGSTAINGMLWSRGHPQNYDAWSKLGNEGWSYEDVLPYFKKLEDSDIKHYSSDYQGKNGRVHLENTHFESNATEYVLRAAHELNIPYVNYNGKKQLGIGHAQGTLKYGKRWSSARAYLGDGDKLPNLTIKTKSTVLKVLIDEVEKKAYGVQYLRNETLHEVHAKKEVILSAGGINTPKLLAVSGIGPMDQLERLGIQTLSNLQVGSVLRTHLAFSGIKVVFENSLLQPENQKRDIVDYLWKAAGPLTGFSSNLVAYFATKNSTGPEVTSPNLELSFAPQRHGDRLAVSINVALMSPKSLGSVKLTDNDPLHAPSIDPNCFQDEGDVDLNTMLTGIRLAQKFVNTTIFKEHGGYLEIPLEAACRSLRLDSDSFWKCMIQHRSLSLFDPVSTAKMGPTSDKTAVVENKLRVYGIKHLRVADTSVVPLSLAGHTMAAGYMIGEKAADLIKFFWKEK